MGNNQAKPTDLDGEVNLNHFRLLRVVGRGAFGKVRIVERKDTGLSFALKYIRKDEVVRSESVRNIIRERRMLEQLNHPFICNLRYSFQDIEYMYLVVDLMTGGDLRFHISRKTFTEEAIRFWIAELACALKYVHAQGIIHRDVKPDNVLLDADGHVHLTDFNVASDTVPGKPMTSKSGTLAYLAPEVYAGKGYDVRADWWSLGVVFYECIYGKRPFDGASEAALSEQVKVGNPRYPITQPPVSPDCIYAMSAALEVDRDKRLGHTWESFTGHEFFSSIDFDLLHRKKIEPIFVPSSEKTNFDATYDLEELLLEEAPLEARARRQKPREKLKDDASKQEIRAEELYRMIEVEYKNYDYTIAAYIKMTEAEATAEEEAPLETTRSQQSATQGQPTALTTDEAMPAEMAMRIPDRSAISRTSTLDRHAGPPPTTDPPPALPSFSRKGTRRVASSTGGVQMTLDPGSSWSDLARQDATLPADANAMAGDKGDHPGGVLSFFNRKKGRASNPKPKEKGVLGKEGARVVIG